MGNIGGMCWSKWKNIMYWAFIGSSEGLGGE